MTAQDWLRLQVGKPYIYGANGPDSYDCSGLACAYLRAQGYEVPDMRARDLERVAVDSHRYASAKPSMGMGVVPTGSLVTYGFGGNAQHIMCALCEVGYEDILVGACGGNSETDTPTAGACVMTKLLSTYQPNAARFVLFPSAFEKWKK